MISYELTKWAGYEKEEWNRENLRLRDDSNASIRNFWTKSGLNQTKEYYPDSAGEQWCTVWCKTFKRAQDLKSHKTRMKHHERKQPVRTNTTVWLEKRKKIQDDLPKVVWKRYTKTVALDRGQLITVQVPRIYIRGGRWTHDGCVHENCDGQNQVWKTVTPVEWQVSTPEGSTSPVYAAFWLTDPRHGTWTLKQRGHYGECADRQDTTSRGIITKVEDLWFGGMGAVKTTTVACPHTQNGVRSQAQAGSVRDV